MARKLQSRRHKYNVGQQSERYSILWKRTFHSVAERRYADHLFALEQNGEIRDVSFQVPVRLGDPQTGLSLTMRVDFKYFDERLAEWVWDEFKGFETSAWRRQKKAWGILGPGLYRVTKANRADKIEPYRFEEIRPADRRDGVAGAAATEHAPRADSLRPAARQDSTSDQQENPE